MFPLVITENHRLAPCLTFESLWNRFHHPLIVLFTEAVISWDAARSAHLDDESTPHWFMKVQLFKFPLFQNFYRLCEHTALWLNAYYWIKSDTASEVNGNCDWRIWMTVLLFLFLTLFFLVTSVTLILIFFVDSFNNTVLNHLNNAAVFYFIIHAILNEECIIVIVLLFVSNNIVIFEFKQQQGRKQRK